MDIEDLTLNSLHTTLVFQAEDKGVAYPPLSSGMTPEYIYIYIYIYCKKRKEVIRIERSVDASVCYLAAFSSCVKKYLVVKIMKSFEFPSK